MGAAIGGTVLELVARGTYYAMSTPTIVEVEDRKLRFTNLHTDLYSGTGCTKRQVIDFYVRIAPGRSYSRRGSKKRPHASFACARVRPTVLGTGSEGRPELDFQIAAVA